MTLAADIERAAAIIASADSLLIGAGAGMGVDSGLPDFRGDEGFWNAYPPFRGMRFAQMSNPVWFARDPAQAWGFFGHRLNLYRETTPHSGFGTLLNWAESRPAGYFVFTSNVDGHFQRAGFAAEKILECHGSIQFLQCTDICSRQVWSSEAVAVSVDMDTIRAEGTLPSCPHCGAVARPNILMFGDYNWLPDRCAEQEARYREWVQSAAGKRVAVLEFGAGESVPTVRCECEAARGKLIRINPRDSHGPAGTISIPLPALEAIQRIDEHIRQTECA